jgi:hypothetical protein
VTAVTEKEVAAQRQRERDEALAAERTGADCVGPGTGWDPLAPLELDGETP